MSHPIKDGAFLVARRIFKSAIWARPPLYLKIWIWILGKASHKDLKTDEKEYERGTFVTCHDEIIRGNEYFHNRRHYSPTKKQVRLILGWLQNQGMIRVNPLLAGLGRTGAHTTAGTRAYIGIKINVLNFDTYQNLNNYKGTDYGRDFSELGQDNNNGNKNDIISLIAELKKRYPSPQLIDQAIQALASVRKGGKVADSVVLAQLNKWARYPAEQVEAGIQVYIEKDCAAQGKGEAYLLGIIRNHKAMPQIQPPNQATGSPLLDRYYADVAN